MQEHHYEDGTPTPEYLIKSIAEQGYSLESSLADLMDNSISAQADKIEVLLNMDEDPFTLFLADNGDGMDEDSLRHNMQFPSSSPDNLRVSEDLGRFGLGMKTASFSQTRCFTVISRKKGTSNYSGRTWNVDTLKLNGWKIIVNTHTEIQNLLNSYNSLSESHLNQFEGFSPNTIVIWSGLYKFENYIEAKNRKAALQKDITEVTNEHLSIVFHRFMERKNNPLRIRVNNVILEPFNPFPIAIPDFRSVPVKQRNLNTDVIKMEGFVLPARSISESKQGISLWTTASKGLMDMEGLYIYRSDRLIRFGGWNGIIRKSARLQLARLMVEVGNGADQLLHLNVAKSQISIPYDLRQAFFRYVSSLKDEAEKEYYNTGNTQFSGKKDKSNITLLTRNPTSKGVLLKINEEFPLLKELRTDLSSKQNASLNIFLRLINNTINKIRLITEDKVSFDDIDKNEISLNDLIACIEQLKKNGFSSDQIKSEIIPNLGYLESSLPTELANLLK